MPIGIDIVDIVDIGVFGLDIDIAVVFGVDIVDIVVVDIVAFGIDIVVAFDVAVDTVDNIIVVVVVEVVVGCLFLPQQKNFFFLVLPSKFTFSGVG